MSASTALAKAQLATVAALAARHPATVTVTEPGESGVDLIAGAWRGPMEWTDDDGIPQRSQGVIVIAAKSKFPTTFTETARGWVVTFEGVNYRVLTVTSWGASWLVRGIR